MNKISFWRLLGVIGGVILVSGIIFYLFSPNFFAEGMMRGGDEAAHMFIPKYIVDYFKVHYHIPVVNPYWYNGIETLHHAPFLDYIPIAAIYLIIKNIYLTNRIFTFLLLLMAGMSIFFLLYKRNGLKAAIVGGIIFPFVPGIFYLARTSVTRVTPFILLPLAFYFADQLFEQDFRFRNFFIFALIVAAMIFSHPITGINSLAFLFVYVIARCLCDRKISFKKLSVWFGAFLLACGLVAWWAVPFLTEPSNYTYPSIVSVSFHSEISSGSLAEILATSGGVLILLLALIAFWRDRSSKNLALFISVVFAFYCVTPLSNPLYSLFTWLFPYAALVWICIVALYLGTKFFKDLKLKPVFRIPIFTLAVPLIIIITLINFNYQHPFWGKIWVEPHENSFPVLNNAFANIDNSGRVFTVKNIGKIDWVIPAVNKKYYSEGHYFSITRFNKEISWMNDAFNEGYYSYFFSKMDLSNDRFFVKTSYIDNFFDNNRELIPEFEANIKKAGYQKVFSEPNSSVSALYYKDEPSSFLIPLNMKTLVIGKHGYNYAAFQPDSYIAGSIYIDDYDLDFLNNFDNLVLYGFGYRDKNKAEDMIRQYAKNGGNVTIDMLNISNSRLESENPIFLGVQSSTEKTTTSMQLELAQNIDGSILPETLKIPSVKNFGGIGIGSPEVTPLNEWRFTEYSNLDSSLLRWQNRSDSDNDIFGLVGYKNIDGNKVWFLGGNLFYHAYLTHNSVEQDFIKELTVKTLGLPPATEPNIDIISQNLDPEAGKIEFNYSAQQTTPLLVSYTISPHWKAYLNDQPIKIYNVDSMMAVNLPAGNNYVTLKYEELPTHYFARGITLATIVILGVVFILGLKKRKARKNV